MKQSNTHTRTRIKLYKPCFEDLILLKSLTSRRDDKMSTNFSLLDISNTVLKKKYNSNATTELKHALSSIIKTLGLIFKEDFIFITTCERGKKWRFRFNNISKLEYEYKLNKFFEKNPVDNDYNSEEHMALFFKNFLSYAIHTEKCLFSLPYLSFATLGLGINVKAFLSDRKSRLKDFMNKYNISIKVVNKDKYVDLNENLKSDLSLQDEKIRIELCYNKIKELRDIKNRLENDFHLNSSILSKPNSVKVINKASLNFDASNLEIIKNL